MSNFEFFYDGEVIYQALLGFIEEAKSLKFLDLIFFKVLFEDL